MAKLVAFCDLKNPEGGWIKKGAVLPDGLPAGLVLNWENQGKVGAGTGSRKKATDRQVKSSDLETREG